MNKFAHTTPLAAKAHETAPVDLVEAFGRMCGEAACFYRRGPDGAEMLAVGEVCASSGDASFGEHFAKLTQQLVEVDGDRHRLGLVGWTAFDSSKRTEQARGALPSWDGFLRRKLFVPEVLLRSDGADTEALVVAPAGKADAVWKRWAEELAGSQEQPPVRPKSFDTSWLDCDRFREGVGEVTEEHVAPKVVLARRALVRVGSSIDPALVLRQLSKTYPSCTTFALSPGAQSPHPVFVGATPEALARVEDGRVETMALAGTARTAEGERPDKAADEALLSGEKERDEQQFVLDMIVDALEPLCETVAAEPEPRLRRLANVSHLMTRISGKLADDRGLAEVVDALHPTPAVCGTPRELARELIGELEGFDRGLYAGALGWMDLDGDGAFDVAIRCGLIDQDDALVFAGAGITKDSDVDVELAETRNKFAPLLDAIAEVSE